MKVPGTKLDIPVPDGWTFTPDLVNLKVILTGTVPDTAHYKDRKCTVTIPLTKDANTGDIRLPGHWGEKTRWQERRMRQPTKWMNDPKTGWGHVKIGGLKPSTGNVQRRTDLSMWMLAAGEFE